jgi:hypothetical protein
MVIRSRRRSRIVRRTYQFFNRLPWFMQDSPLSAVAMIVGLVLIAAGYFSPSLTPTSAVWTDKQAEEYGKTAATLHSASYGSGHDHSKDQSHDRDPHKSPEYIAAKAAFDKNLQALESARSRQSWLKYSLIAAGVIIAGTGIVQVCLAKMKEDDLPGKRR